MARRIPSCSWGEYILSTNSSVRTAEVAWRVPSTR